MEKIRIKSILLFFILFFAWVSCEGEDKDDNTLKSEDESEQSGNIIEGEEADSTGFPKDASVGGDGGVAIAPLGVAGTGKECASYATPENGMCGSYYCGVNLETLTKEIDPTQICGDDPDFTCKGSLVTSVGDCARKVKSENISQSNDELRPKVEACAYEDPEIKERVSPDCLACFITAAICAGDNCLIQCLVGDSPLCDSCREANNCDAQVFQCGGLPSPF